MSDLLTSAPGTIEYRSLDFEGHKMPLVVATGKREGPTLVVTGVQHATEFPGPAALDRVFPGLDLERMAGRLIGLPFVNPLQLHLTPEEFRESWKNPETNLNRQWPGDAASANVLSRLAAFVWSSVLVHANAVLDFHCCRRVDPDFSASLEGDPAGLALAQALGLDAVDLETADSYAHGVMIFAVPEKLKIPAVLIELRGGGFPTRETVDTAVSCVFRAMMHLGMVRIWRRPKRKPAPTPIFHRPQPGHSLRTTKAGFLCGRRWAGDFVRAGETVAVIRSEETFEIIEELKSPITGGVGSCGVSDTEPLVKPGQVAATVKPVDLGPIVRR